MAIVAVTLVVATTLTGEVDDLPDMGPSERGFWFRRWSGPDTGTSRMTGLASSLVRADLRLKPFEWILAVIAIAVVAGIAFGLLLGNPLAAIIGVIFGVCACQLFLSVRQRHRAVLFETQLVDALLTLRSALRAGSSFPQALASVARATPSPCGDEFSRVIRELDLGLPMDRSLNNLVERNDSEDLALLVVAVQVHREVGGNLARTIERISRVIQDRLRVKGDVRVLTAQPRLSGTALALLPVLLGLALLAISPNYFKPMFNDSLGLALLGGAAISVIIGYYLLRRIARVDFY